jgi:hypothetical protein
MVSKKRGNLLLGIREERVHAGAHIAYFWETQKEFSEAVGFLEVGFRAEDYGVVFGHGEANAKVIAALERRKVNVKRLEDAGRLVEIGGQPTGDATLASIGAAFQKMVDAGAPLIRLLGNIGWGRKGWPSEDDILAFEARVTQAALNFPCIVVCMYETTALSGRIMVHGAFETHPLTFCGNVMRENTHYVAVEEFLARRKQTA